MSREISSPYVGLRPFDREDRRIFFGRKEQTTELLERLYRTHFLAVVGTSGSGKSSLVRAGLIPALLSGFLVEGRRRWRIVTMKPGEAPHQNLVRELSGAFGDAKLDEAAKAIEEGHVEGLLESIRPRLSEEKANLLLVVDQFEEIFHYRGLEDEEQLDATSPEQRREQIRRRQKATDFVDLVLELAAAAERKDHPIYTVLTMRSDFLGNCDLFYGLPQAMNRSQYLVPRLGRRQLREAIEGPVSLFDAWMTTGLRNQLLNDLGSRSDRLPILQHALLRTWKAWEKDGKIGEIDFRHYEMSGRLDQAISKHAQKVGGEKELATTVRVFKALTDTDLGHRRVRRSASFSELVALSGDTEEAVEAVVGRFATEGCNFLLRSHDAGTEQRVEISHESLIRQWDQLRNWVDEEREDRDRFLDLLSRAHTWSSAGGDLLPGKDLRSFREWWHRTRPSLAWAQRHEKGKAEYQLAKRYLALSGARETSSRRRRWAIGALLIIVALLAASLYVQNESERRLNKRRQRINDARMLEANAELVMNESAHLLQRSVLLAAESLRRFEKLAKEEPEVSLGVDHVLHHGIDLLGVPAGEVLQHAGQVVAVAINADGRYVATASADKAVHHVQLWKPKTGQSLRRWEFSERVHDLALTANGQYLATAGNDKTARLLETKSGQELLRVDHGEVVLDVIFSPHEKYLATASADQTACLVDLETKEQTWLSGHSAAIGSVAFDPEEEYVATGSDDGTVRVWITTSGERKAVLETSRSTAGGVPYPFTKVSFNRDGSLLAAVSYDRVYVWRVTDFSEVAQLSHEGEIWAIAFNPEKELGGELATASHRAARVWDVLSGHEIQHLQHEDNVMMLAFSPDGEYIATGSHDRTARVWHTRTGQEVLRMIHQKRISGLAFSGKGEFLVTGSDDRRAQLWFAPASFRTGPFFHHSLVRDVAFRSDGKVLATASYDGDVSLWSVPEKPSEPPGKRERIQSLKHPDNDAVFAIAFSPDGQTLATGGRDKTVRLWNLTNSQFVVGPTHDGSIEDVVFSRDGSLIATASHDGTARLWDVVTRKERGRLENPSAAFYSVAFQPEGTLLAASTLGQVLVWDPVTNQKIPLAIEHDEDPLLAVAFSPEGQYLVAAGEHPSIFQWEAKPPWKVVESRISHEGDIYALAFSADGEYLASGGQYGAKIWRFATGEQVAQVSHFDKVRAVAFRPDRRYLATGSHDFTARLWPLQPADMIFEACTRLTFDLNEIAHRRFFGDEPHHKICAP
jgi:WD40 repeat protein